MAGVIREDPERPGVFVVDVSEPMMSELSREWSRPVRIRVEEDELVMRSAADVELAESRWATKIAGEVAVELVIRTDNEETVAAVEAAAEREGLELERLA